MLCGRVQLFIQSTLIPAVFDFAPLLSLGAEPLHYFISQYLWGSGLPPRQCSFTFLFSPASLLSILPPDSYQAAIYSAVSSMCGEGPGT